MNLTVQDVAYFVTSGIGLVLVVFGALAVESNLQELIVGAGLGMLSGTGVTASARKVGK